MHKRALFFTILLVLMLMCIPIALREDDVSKQDVQIVNLVVDVIPGADVGSGSRENWLRERAEEFEAENEGIFMIVRSLKTDQAETIYTNDLREQMGNIAAFSCGALQYADAFLPLESGCTAQPYMYAGYVLLLNPAMCVKQDDVWQIPTLAASISAFDSGAVTAAEQFAQSDTAVMLCERSQMISLFSSQEVSAIIASNYLGYRFCRAAEKGDGFPVEMLPLSNGFTDQMHYVSVIDQTDVQNTAAKAFVQYLLSEQAQKTCADIGMFATDETCQTYEQRTILCSLWENQAAMPLHPDPFIWAGSRDLAMDLARQMLAGESSAGADLHSLLESLAIDGAMG